MPEPRELVLIRGSHRLTPRSRKDVTTSCSARPQQRGPWPQPQPTWAGCSWRKRCVLRRPGTGRRISGWRRPATPGGSAGPAAGREWGPVVADRPPAWCLLVKTVPSIPGTLPRAVCPPRPQDRKTVARTALLEGGGGDAPNRGQGFSEFTVGWGEGTLGLPPRACATTGRVGAGEAVMGVGRPSSGLMKRASSLLHPSTSPPPHTHNEETCGAPTR